MTKRVLSAAEIQRNYFVDSERFALASSPDGYRMNSGKVQVLVTSGDSDIELSSDSGETWASAFWLDIGEEVSLSARVSSTGTAAYFTDASLADKITNGGKTLTFSPDAPVAIGVTAGVIEVGNTGAGVTSLLVSGNMSLTGVGGVKLTSFDSVANSVLTYDPIATPIMVSATPTFADGVKIALSSGYASVSCGRIVLMTYSGTATVPDGLFDTTSIAGSCVLSQETAPDGESVQLVLTVGDYASAPEIRILPIGDSITQGVRKDDQGDYPQYRTGIAARLAANGYKPVMKGVWHFADDDAAGVQQPDDWRWHCGISGDAIMTSDNSTSLSHGGVRDNLHLYLDIAGYTDVITLLIGTNDVGSGGESAEDTFVAYTNLVADIAAQRPDAKIIGSLLLDRNTETDAKHTRVVAFNGLLQTAFKANALPSNYVLIDLFTAVPLATEGNFFTDNLHPNWKGQATIASTFASKIMETLPLTSFTGTTDETVTDVAQTALGAASTIPGEYLAGMKHVFTLDAANAANAFSCSNSAPYTATNVLLSLDRKVKKAGYYMELVRTGTNRRRYVWVDFDVKGKTLDEIDFPWTGDNIHMIVTNMHVYSNDTGIHTIAADADGITGIIEGTYHNYSKPGELSGAPADMLGSDDTHGWDDTLGSGKAGYACFQAHRIFTQTEGDTHWNNAEVLFAWNRWGENQTDNVDEIGIGSYACHASGINSMDYTFTARDGKEGLPDTVSASAYQVRHIEIWVAPQQLIFMVR